MVKVLIVDDSKVIQTLMRHILSSDPEIEVIGIAGSGSEAIRLVRELRPDVITMDFYMPEMNGYEATRIIMENDPTPIVIVSGSLSTKEVSNSLRLMEVGALAVVLLPPYESTAEFEVTSKELTQTVKLMSEIRVVRRFPDRNRLQSKSAADKNMSVSGKEAIRLIAIGASTGGPLALQKILSKFPADLTVPVLIVQHIAAGFVKGFTDWLSISSAIEVKVAEHDEILRQGVAYIAPDNLHMGITKGLRIQLKNTPQINGLKPAVDHLFHTVSETVNNNAIGILLTGMGKDGAFELKNMKDNGAITIIQDKESSVVFGMPGEALRIGGANHVLPIDKIGDFVNALLLKNKIQ